MSPDLSDGFAVKAHVGDGAVLLAFDLPSEKATNLAGFAVKCVTPDAGPYLTNEYFLKNRLNFEHELTAREKLNPAKFISSDKAPFQTFHWIHFPSAGLGQYRYIVYASYFRSDGSVELGPSVGVDVDLTDRSFPGLELGFTRGYVSSQAYADRFHNRKLRPEPRSVDFDTASYQAQYYWLGAHARRLMLAFLKECQSDPSISLDVCAYDFDEPDVIRALCQIGSRVRVFQDDAPLHAKRGSMEPKTLQLLKAAGANVTVGHFRRFAHNKVMIQNKNKKAVKVLTGSANFSVRGLYVQANSILVFEDTDVAALYEKAFEQAFTEEDRFRSSEIASRWWDIRKGNLPTISVSFAPHSKPFPLDRVAEAMNSSRSSVFFALMQLGGKGAVRTALENLANRKDLFSLGTIQSKSQLKLFKPGIDPYKGATSYAFLEKDVPEPFKREWSGGPGQVIHHKFVVCDFNDQSPVVFCGSSNLAAGGETSNGDNLVAIYDHKIAASYVVEAIRLYDHYRFRSLHQHSTSKKPLCLDSTDGWTERYYDPKNIKFRERQLLVQGS